MLKKISDHNSRNIYICMHIYIKMFIYPYTEVESILNKIDTAYTL